MKRIALPLPMRATAKPETWLGKFLLQDEEFGPQKVKSHEYPWYKVLWLTGVDYFSTLGYQPGIALIAAGFLSPVATVFLVLITLFGALPVYSQVAKRSFAGQGSIALLETLFGGWTSKIVVLVLLGFAATDFVITMTLSAADAAVHAIENPILHPYLDGHEILITCLLLFLLAAVFMRGFKEAISLAAAIAIPFLVLNLIVLLVGLKHIIDRPELLNQWMTGLWATGSLTDILIVAALVFPKLALGMSGFETGVSVMPLIKGEATDPEETKPTERIRSTHHLLLAAALIMSSFLLLSSFVTACLIPPQAYQAGGPASGRAIAYLAHELLGEFFGTVYDVSTILILWFAGASAMAGLLNLIPRYLPRFGMAPRSIAFRRPLVMVLFFITLLVTWFFKADVEAQGGAYATGVLVLILSASVAVAVSFKREHRKSKVKSDLIKSFFFWAISALFLYTLIENILIRPDGAIIAGAFILLVIFSGALSRYLRATELRVSELAFKDEESWQHWQDITFKKVHLAPTVTNTEEARKHKERQLRKYYHIKGPIAFTHVHLVDNRSEFYSPLRTRVRKVGDNYIINVYGALAVANSIAYISELLDPLSIFIGLTRQNLMTQALKYLFFGEGETGLLIYTILVRYWEWTPEEDVRPKIFLFSD